MGFSNSFGERTRAPLVVRPGEPGDVAAVMAIERGPGFEAFVGRSEASEHQALMAAPGFAYRIGVGADGAPVAFAIVSGLADPHGNLYLKRIAAASPGAGVGTTLLAAVLDEAFGTLGAWRFHLDCFADNDRAQRAYQKLGFSRDGVLRQAYRLPDGARTDLVLMALLKPEWQARRAGT